MTPSSSERTQPDADRLLVLGDTLTKRVHVHAGPAGELEPFRIAVVVVVVGAGLLALACVLHRYRVRQRAIATAWRRVDARLRLRHELVTDLIQTVKRHAPALPEIAYVTEAHTDAAVRSDGQPRDRQQPETVFGPALRQLLRVTEDHRELRSDARYVALCEKLAYVESRLGEEREHYNEEVSAYNRRVAGLAAPVRKTLMLDEADAFLPENRVTRLGR